MLVLFKLLSFPKIKVHVIGVFPTIVGGRGNDEVATIAIAPGVDVGVVDGVLGSAFGATGTFFLGGGLLGGKGQGVTA